MWIRTALKFDVFIKKSLKNHKICDLRFGALHNETAVFSGPPGDKNRLHRGQVIFQLLSFILCVLCLEKRVFCEKDETGRISGANLGKRDGSNRKSFKPLPEKVEKYTDGFDRFGDPFWPNA